MLLVPLIFGAYKGYQKGLVMELAQLLALVIATIAGLKLYQLGMIFLKPMVGDFYGFLSYLSFAIIFVSVIFLMNWIGKLAKKLIKMVLLGWLDKIMGAILAIMKWGFALSVVVWFLFTCGLSPKTSTIEQTYLYKPMVKAAPSVIKFVGKIIPIAKGVVNI